MPLSHLCSSNKFHILVQIYDVLVPSLSNTRSASFYIGLCGYLNTSNCSCHGRALKHCNTLHMMKHNLYWKGMKGYHRFVQECETCPRNKGRLWLHQVICNPCIFLIKSGRKSLWTSFITWLPSSSGKEFILVVVDMLRKMAHFIKHPYTASNVAQVFLDCVHKLHGIPRVIVVTKIVYSWSSFGKNFLSYRGWEITCFHYLPPLDW